MPTLLAAFIILGLVATILSAGSIMVNRENFRKYNKCMGGNPNDPDMMQMCTTMYGDWN